MGGLGLKLPSLLGGRLAGLLVEFIHLVGVAVVGGDEGDAAPAASITGSRRASSRSTASMAMVAARKLPVWPTMSPLAKLQRRVCGTAALQGGDHGVGDLGGLHPRALLEGHHVAGDFLPGLAVELAGAVAVPEIGDVAELLGLRAGELGDAGLANHSPMVSMMAGGADQEALPVA